MPRKNEKVTHVRISQEHLGVIESIKGKNETNRQVLARIIEDYDSDGIRRELVKKVSDLQLFANNFIHPDLHSTLEVLKVIFYKIESSTNQIQKSVVCRLLEDTLNDICNNKIEKIIIKNKPEKK